MKRVLVVATSRQTRGGITAVVNAHSKGVQWSKYHIKWIGAYVDRSNWMKILIFLTSLCHYLVVLPFYDLVHIHVSTHVSVFRKSFYLYPAKWLGKKVIIHLHCSTPSIIETHKRLYRNAFLASDLILVLSSQWKEFIKNTLGISERVIVLYNPIISLPQAGKHYGKKKYILFAGTVDKRKGYHDLIASFSMVSMLFPDWRLLIAGNGEVEEGKSLAKRLGIDAKVEFLGWITGDTKDTVFGEASIYCLPSYAEGFPMSVLDAWAYGLPVVCTPVGGIMDVAKDGENIMLFNPGNIKMLSEKLSLLMGNACLRESIALHSRTLSDTIFNLNRINSQLGDLYKQLLGE